MIDWPIEIKENKYKHWYEALMYKAQSREMLVGYKERHHIIPNCFVKNKNVVELTAREHYIAHLLLWKMTMAPKQHNQMTMALNVMVNGSGHKKQDRSYLVNSRIYEAHRKEYSEYLSEYMSGPGNPFRGKKHSPEVIEKIKEANRRTKHIRSAKATGVNNPMYGKKHSEEIKARIRANTAAAWTDDLKTAKSKQMIELWKDPEYANAQAEKKKTSPGWLSRDWKAINRKAADTKMANGWKPSEETKKKQSAIRKAKLASGEIVPWNRGIKLKPEQIRYNTYTVISPANIEYNFKGREELKKFCSAQHLGYWSMIDLINGKQGKNRLYLDGWRSILSNVST
jgi:hypothetical protein